MASKYFTPHGKENNKAGVCVLIFQQHQTQCKKQCWWQTALGVFTKTLWINWQTVMHEGHDVILLSKINWRPDICIHIKNSSWNNNLCLICCCSFYLNSLITFFDNLKILYRSFQNFNCWKEDVSYFTDKSILSVCTLEAAGFHITLMEDAYRSMIGSDLVCVCWPVPRMPCVSLVTLLAETRGEGVDNILSLCGHTLSLSVTLLCWFSTAPPNDQLWDYIRHTEQAKTQGNTEQTNFNVHKIHGCTFFHFSTIVHIDCLLEWCL